MRARSWQLAVLAACALALQAQAPAPAEDVAALLERQTQELMDAITSGSAAVWDRYLDPGVVYTTEDGTVLDKAKFLEQIRPLPAGVSGDIRVTDFKATVHGEVAVTTHVEDEHEDYHGHKLHCRYRTTDTWLRTPAGWRLIGGQILALRTDPPAVPLTARQMEEYSGRYALTPEITYEIRREGDRLVGQQSGRQPETLSAEAPDVLFVPGRPRYRKIFERGPDGRIESFLERREAWDLEWTRLSDSPRP